MAQIGSTAARSVHGFSASADVLLLGTPAPSPALVAALLEAGVQSRPQSVEAADLAPLAASSDTNPLVIVAADLILDGPALLDLCDRPGTGTAALVADPYSIEMPQPVTGVDQAALLRVGADAAAVESAGSSRHTVARPNRISVGALRIAAEDRLAAAQAWTTAGGQWAAHGPTDPARTGRTHSDRLHSGLDALAPHQDPDPGRDDFDLALVALVRGGVRVAPVRLGYFTWQRGETGQPGSTGGPWHQRLRTASRGGDGFFSAAVVRPLSRRGTVIGLRHGWTPNVLTLVSLLVGLLTAALVWAGPGWTWVVAAVGLQLALVIDCMDGEVARFTRRFSALGAWLDGVGDRVKEYAVFAALGAVATAQGTSSGWLLAVIAMAVVTARHLEDQCFNDQLAPTRRSTLVLLSMDVADEDAAAWSTLRRPGRRQALTFWVKKVLHVPIAERYLVLSGGLLTMQPVWVLGAAIATSGFALLWTQGGRLISALMRPRPAPAEALPLDDQLDLGSLARLAGRLGRLPFLAGFGATLALWLVLIAGVCAGWHLVAVVAALGSAITLGLACRSPLRHRLGWQALPLVWTAEAAIAAALVSQGALGPYVFVWLAVIAYRRYDLIYSLKLTDRRPGAWSAVLGLGAEGRIVAVTLLAWLATLTDAAPRAIAMGLLVGAAYLALVSGAQSVRQWCPTPARATTPATTNEKSIT